MIDTDKHKTKVCLSPDEKKLFQASSLTVDTYPEVCATLQWQ